MKRIEVILTQAIEEDFVALYEKACRQSFSKCKYTKINDVVGQGNTDPKLGDAIWPQLNVMFVLYVEEKFVPVIANIMKKLHKKFVGEGAVAFISDAKELI